MVASEDRKLKTGIYKSLTRKLSYSSFFSAWCTLKTPIENIEKMRKLSFGLLQLTICFFWDVQDFLRSAKVRCFLFWIHKFWRAKTLFSSSVKMCREVFLRISIKMRIILSLVSSIYYVSKELGRFRKIAILDDF